MKTTSRSLELASQVLEEQLSLLSDTPDGIDVDMERTRAILNATKQICNVEKLKLDQDRHELQKNEFILDLCKSVSNREIDNVPLGLESQIKRINYVDNN